MRVYIAGPLTPLDGRAQTRRAHIRRASEAARLLIAAGHTPFCPHTMTQGWEEACSYQHFLQMDLEWLRLCEAVLLLPGWRDSVGARGEYEEARRLGLIVWELLEDGVMRPAELEQPQGVAPCN